MDTLDPHDWGLKFKIAMETTFQANGRNILGEKMSEKLGTNRTLSHKTLRSSELKGKEEPRVSETPDEDLKDIG